MIYSKSKHLTVGELKNYLKDKDDDLIVLLWNDEYSEFFPEFRDYNEDWDKVFDFEKEGADSTK